MCRHAYAEDVKHPIQQAVGVNSSNEPPLTGNDEADASISAFYSARASLLKCNSLHCKDRLPLQTYCQRTSAGY